MKTLKKSHVDIAVLTFALGLCLAAMPSAQGRTIYVDGDVSASGDGLAWDQAKKTIGEGIAAAVADDQVWVAEGTYLESIVMKESVALFGGFSGQETARAERDLNVHETIIDASTANNGQPAHHVIFAENLTSLYIDGFTITGGYAAEGTENSIKHGGGIYGCWPPLEPASQSVTHLILNCKIVKNRSKYSGAGINFAFVPKVLVSNCMFLSNTAESSFGGAMSIEYSNYIKIDDCFFAENIGISGAGVAIINPVGTGPVGTFSVSNSVFQGNNGSHGGGLNIHGQRSAPCEGTVKNCIFDDNEGTQEGGGLDIENYVTAGIFDCVFIRNESGFEGGGLSIGLYNDISVERCIFIENHTGTYGGGLVNSIGQKLSVKNSLFAYNIVDGYGGGISSSDADISVINCTFVENIAEGAGAAIVGAAFETTKFYNNIFCDSTGIAVADLSGISDLVQSNNLFYHNPDGDYLDGDGKFPYNISNGVTYFSADAINSALESAHDNLSGAPGFAPPESGLLSDDPVFTLETRSTLIHDGLAHFTPGALKGRILLFGNDDQDKRLIIGNTASTITFIGEPGEGVTAGTSYAILNFSPVAESMAVDRGTDLYAPDHDLFGNPRPRDVAGAGDNGTGKEFDIGAFEMQTPESKVRGGWILYE